MTRRTAPAACSTSRISQATVTNIQTLKVDTITLTAAQLSGVQNLQGLDGVNSAFELDAATEEPTPWRARR